MGFPTGPLPTAGPDGDLADAVDELSVHFARELHDQVAQPLVSLILELHEVRASRELNGGVLDARMAQIEDSARRVLRQTREMLIDLRGPQSLRLDFAKALRSELARNLPSVRPEIHTSSRWPRHINGWAAFNLLRIAQEAVTNAVRHGRASKIDIFCDTNSAGEAVMAVVDDGIGIDGALSGFGMIGMSERAVVLGGTFKAETRDTGGGRIEVRVPVDQLVDTPARFGRR